MNKIDFTNVMLSVMQHYDEKYQEALQKRNHSSLEYISGAMKGVKRLYEAMIAYDADPRAETLAALGLDEIDIAALDGLVGSPKPEDLKEECEAFTDEKKQEILDMIQDKIKNKE